VCAEAVYSEACLVSRIQAQSEDGSDLSRGHNNSPTGDALVVLCTNIIVTCKFTPYLPYYLGFSQAAQAMTAAGAVSVTTAVTTLNTSGAIAITLAAGTTHQVKFISMIVDGGTATLTPATFTGGTTIAFNDAGDSCVLMYLDSTYGWVCVANNGCTIA